MWRWYDLGTQLGVPEAALKTIECDYQRTDDRRTNMLIKWRKIDDNPSWSKVVSALVAIKECSVARNIAEKYGKSLQIC